MNRRPNLFYTTLAYGAIYPLLLALLVGGTLACSLLLNLSHRLIAPEPPPPQIQRLAALPGQSTPRPPQPAPPTDRLAAITIATLPPAPPPDPLLAPAQAAPPVEIAAALPPPASPALDVPPPASPTGMMLDLAVYANRATATRAPRSTTAPDDLLGGLVTGLLGEAEAPAVGSLNSLPTLTPTPTATSTPPPTETPTSTPTFTSTPVPAPTETPTAPPPPTETPLPTPTPTETPRPTPPPPPTNTPEPTATAAAQYDFLLNEFFNSPTTNHFLVMYVSIVDTNEIPIGDMKIIGTRQDYNLTYESPLSTWHYEGYNAPGEVIKSGNVKFEPPGGIEDTAWVFYLADAHGNRMSDDVPFTTTATDRQWYFVKFKRKF